MCNLRVYPALPHGVILAPPSKSAAHRALICAALAGGGSRVSPVSHSADMEATLGVLGAMGARLCRAGAGVVCAAAPSPGGAAVLNCGESGSTFRFLLPVAAALGIAAAFHGDGRLPDRPADALTKQLAAHGVTFSGARMPFAIGGRLTGGQFALPGDISSQFVSGLLFALPLLAEDSEIVLTSPLQSAGYVDMTLAALAEAGVTVETTPAGYRIKGGQDYRPGGKTVEGDWSNAAFWLCAGAIGGGVTVRGLDTSSTQGDRAVTEILRRFGGVLSVGADAVTCEAAPLSGCRVDAAPIPDLVPILAVTAAFARGETEIYNAARLRIKESDRLATVAALLRGLGGRVEEYPDRLVIHGGGLRGGAADGANDHRIVMAAAVAAQFCREPVSIYGVQAVKKSYPDFFDDLRKLGGRFDVIDVG